jgi:hypothetical protein
MNITTGRFLQESLGIINMGSGTFKLKGSGIVWSCAVGSTVNRDTSTIELNNNSTNNQTFNGNGKTYNNLVLSGTGITTTNFVGSNTFNEIKSNKIVAHTMLFTATTTTTVNSFTVSGTNSNNMVTIGSITAAQHTLTKAGGGTITCDFLNVSRSTGSPAATWSATPNSIDGGNNINWTISTNPYTWTGTTNSNWSVGTNWFNGVNAPGAGNIAYFTGTSNVACTIDSAINVLGINVGRNYTGTITQSADMTIGTSGFEFNGLTSSFLGSANNITCDGSFVQTAGTLFRSTSGTFQVTASNSDTFAIKGGTFTHNSGFVKVNGT